MAPQSRRAVLALGTLGLGTAALVREAVAFSIMEPDATTRRLYESACTDRAARHADLVAEVRRTLGADGEPASEAEVRRAVRAINCPFCGCALAATLPDAGLEFDAAPFGDPKS